MTHDTDSFVQEVDQSLRQDRVMRMIRRYGPYALGALAVALLLGFAWTQWRSFQLSQSRTHSDDYVAAQELAAAGNLDEAKAAFEALTGDGPRVYRVMARMEHAAVLQAQGDLEAALAEFDAAAAAASDPVMRDTARLRAAYIAAETGDFAALQRRLDPLIRSETRLSFLARELLAIEAWENGDMALARETLQGLTLAFDAPESVRERAQLALSVVGRAPGTSADGAEEAPAPSEGETK